MRISLPVKLGTAVVIILGLTLAACLMGTPLRVRYYKSKLKSDNPKERVAGVGGLSAMGNSGITALAEAAGCENEEAEFIVRHWKKVNEKIAVGVEERLFPLYVALDRGYKKAAEYFILNNADVNACPPCPESHSGKSVFADINTTTLILIGDRCRHGDRDP